MLAVGEGIALDVILALPPKEIVDGGVADGDDVRLSVSDSVNGGVDKPLTVEEGLILSDDVEVGDGTALDVILALPPNEIVDGGVSDDEDVRLCVGRGVGVIVNVAETLELVVGETVLETDDESVLVSALDGEAVTIAVILLDGVCEDEGVCVNDGIIIDDEGVRVTELVSDDDKLEEIDAVTLGDTVLLGVDDVDAPRVTEVEGVFDSEELKLGVDDVDGVNVPVFEPELVGVTLGVRVIKGVGVPETEEVKVSVFELVGLLVNNPDGVFDTVPVPVFVARGVNELVTDVIIRVIDGD